MLRTVRGVSIERRLPLLMSLLLLIVIVALSWSAYREVRRSAIAGARERLETVTTQLTSSNAEGYRQRVAQVARFADHEALRRFFAAPTPAAREEARLRIAPLAADTPQSIGVSLRSLDGARALVVGDSARIARIPPATLGDSAHIGALATIDSTIAFPIVAPVRDSGRVIGHLVAWQRVNTSPRARRAVAGILGNDAMIFLGNPAGDVWVDLGGQRDTPAAVDLSTGGVTELQREGRLQLAMVRPVAGTPWLMEVDFPLGAVLSGLGPLLRRILILSAAVLLVGIVASWVVSRHITRPLGAVSDAADRLAAGSFPPPLNDASGDEIGRLARAFNVMAGQVQRTQHDLEHQVAERTRELWGAMQRLEEAQDELLRKERLALLGQLSSSVGHELRNPLGVMNNAVYYLEAVLTDAPPTAREYLGILREQIAVSEKIVSDLLDFARVRKPEKKVIALRELLAQQLQGQGVPPNVRVAVDLAPDAAAVWADPVHVAQIVRNLASNAYQAMDGPGGTLTVRASHDGPGNVQIDVSDTGPGIAPELIDKVFEPLFTTKARGIGLGLPLSRTLAAANGGALTVKSRPGSGATFSLVLPAPAGEAT